MGESDVSIVLLNSVVRRSSSLFDVHLAAFTGNPVNYAIVLLTFSSFSPFSTQVTIAGTRINSLKRSVGHRL